MLGFILGTMTGGVMGIFAMCLFIAGKREDEALERCRMKPKEIIDHGVCICFVNSQGQELFRLSDGESLVQNAPNGERNVSTCHYLDTDSAMIDGKKWNLLEFAKEMEKILPTLIKESQPIFIILIALGGVMYTMGTFFYSKPQKRYFHFVWHIFIILASI